MEPPSGARPGAESHLRAEGLSYLLAGGVVVRSLAGPVDRSDLPIAGGRVAAESEAATRFDASGCIVAPGNVCAHHHLYSYLARGMPPPARPPRNFLDILRSVWWRLDRALDLETIALSALAGAVEAVRRGTTSVVDHHSSPEAIEHSLDAVAGGIEQAGARGIVCYEVSDRHGEASGRRGVEENARFLASDRGPLVRGMMGAHASFTIGCATLDSLVGAARGAGAPIHVHLAEDSVDERDSLERYGVRAALRLRRAGGLERGDLVAHGVWLDTEELEVLRSSGAWLAHNPRSNMNNAVGYAPVAAMGAKVALGTDGIDGDMFAEARACHLRGREAGVDPAPLARLSQGAKLVGARFEEPLLGSLVPGAPADLVVLDYQPPTPLDASSLAAHYLFGLGGWAVRDVMVAGRWVVRDRRPLLVDEEELAARCRAAALPLWERMQRYSAKG